MSNEPDSEFIVFRCECGQKLKVPVEQAGVKGRCKACGRRMVVPTPDRPIQPGEPPPRSAYYSSPVHRRDFEGEFSEEDLVTYPQHKPIRKQPVLPAEMQEEKKSLFEMLGQILRYPVADKLAVQIFLSGAILFGPLVWKAMIPGRYMPCCLGILLNIFILLVIISIRLMYFSYTLMIIEKSAEGSRKIPELPVFQTWQENLQDLLRVLAASAVAFAPYLVYAASLNIEVVSSMLEAYNRGETPSLETMGDIPSNLGALMLLYAIAALYMPMVLMILVVTKRLGKAVNPVFVFRSIFRLGREYLAAMLIIFLFLRGSLTLFTIIEDVLASGLFAAFLRNIGEPIVKFYVFVVTMHVIGLLYYRNGDKLEW